MEEKNSLPDEETLISLADLFKNFSDTTRVKILCLLSGREWCVNDIAKETESSQTAVSHHLRILKQSKLVRSRREGKTIYYSLSDEHVEKIIGNGLEHVNE